MSAVLGIQGNMKNQEKQRQQHEENPPDICEVHAASREKDMTFLRNKKKRSIFLTGGRGMVGSNILEHPKAREWEITAPTSTELDLMDYRATLRYMKSCRPGIVVHAAGNVGGIQANIAQPVDFLVTNIDIGRNVIIAAREAGVSKLLNLASSCMYPRNAPNPLTEDMVLTGELEPTNEGYALAKIFATRLCQYITRENRANKYKTLVPCNLYGRHDSFDPERSHLVPAIIDKIHNAKTTRKDVVEIWGDGEARREFMYAGDLADAVMKACDDVDVLPDVMNVGLGFDYTVNEYYQAVADVIGWKGRFVHDLGKPVGMKQKLINIERQSRWGWKATTQLREGIAETYRFYLAVCT